MKNAPSKQRLVVMFLVLVHGVVLVGGFVAPYDPIRQNRERPYAPPAAIHFVDGQGKFHFRPFVYGHRLREGSFDQYEDDHATPIPLKFFVSGASYRLLGIIPAKAHLFGADEATVNVLGTDGYGRDLFSRILYGGQISLLAGLLAASSESREGVFDRRGDDWVAGMGQAGATRARGGSEREGTGFRASGAGIWRLQFVYFEAAHPAADKERNPDAGGDSDSTIYSRRSNAVVSWAGYTGTGAELGKFAE